MEGERFFSPGGLWIVVRPEVGKPCWVVWVRNFASFKYVRHEYPDEASARRYADMYKI